MSDFLNESGKVDKHGIKLSHWQQGEVMQFVTFRLADAMPSCKLKEWRQQHALWMDHHPRPWSPKQENEYHTRFTRRLEAWLDQGSGSCLFKHPLHRQFLEAVLMRFHGIKVEHHSWVIMPNHVHLVFTPLVSIASLIKAWKGVSSRAIGSGSIWQRNYRDTLIRDASHFANAVRYIRRNPVNLPPNTFTLWQGPRALAVP